MTTLTQNIPDNCEVAFSPTNKQLGEIKKWLIAENKETGDGFFCNWKHIKSSFNNNELATISINNKAIGFASWYITTVKTARIEITEIKPSHRQKGMCKKLTDQLIKFLKDKNIHVIDLECSPSNSEVTWKRLGFIEFIDLIENKNNRLYKILNEHLQQSFEQKNDETIELWDDEPCKIKEDTPPTYIWNLEFVNNTRRLSKPIIQPASNQWRIC